MFGRLMIIAAAIMYLAGSSNAALAKNPKGVWLTESKKAHVEIYDCGSKLCGKVVWLLEPNDENGIPKLDKNNTDAAKSKMPLMGSAVISGMVQASSKLWKDGEIYDANDGKIYASKMQMTDEKTLEVSGCIFFFCKDQIWLRVD